MKYVLRCLSLIALIMCIGLGSAFAVGYERVPVGNARPVKVYSGQSYLPRGWTAVKKATFVEKIPGVIDDAAMTFKGLLGQFGLTLKHTR